MSFSQLLYEEALDKAETLYRSSIIYAESLRDQTDIKCINTAEVPEDPKFPQVIKEFDLSEKVRDPVISSDGFIVTITDRLFQMEVDVRNNDRISYVERRNRQINTHYLNGEYYIYAKDPKNIGGLHFHQLISDNGKKIRFFSRESRRMEVGQIFSWKGRLFSFEYDTEGSDDYRGTSFNTCDHECHRRCGGWDSDYDPPVIIDLPTMLPVDEFAPKDWCFGTVFDCGDYLCAANKETLYVAM